MNPLLCLIAGYLPHGSRTSQVCFATNKGATNVEQGSDLCVGYVSYPYLQLKAWLISAFPCHPGSEVEPVPRTFLETVARTVTFWYLNVQWYLYFMNNDSIEGSLSEDKVIPGSLSYLFIFNVSSVILNWSSMILIFHQWWAVHDNNHNRMH